MRLTRHAELLPLVVLVACAATPTNPDGTRTDAPPTAVVTSPASATAVAAATRVLLQGYALDAAEPSPSLTARWFVDDIEACAGTVPAADGAVACPITASSGGVMEVRLEVTDAAGQADVDSIALTVTPAPAPDNVAPTCAFTSPPQLGSSVLGERVELAGIVADPDGAVERLTVQWVGDRAGVLGASTPTSTGEVAFATDVLGVGLVNVRMIVTDPAGATCADRVSWRLLVPPTITLALPVAGTVALLGDAVQLETEVSDADSASTELVLHWESDLDGVFYEGHADDSGTAAFETEGLSAGTHALSATVTDPSGLQAVAVSSITIDAPPTAPTVSLSPTDPTTRDPLVASIDTPATDPDGDALTYLYAWTVDGVASSASVASTVPASATTAGEVWTVAVSATDGFATSPVGTASVNIVSSGPVVTSVTVTPRSAAVGQALMCAGAAEDADGSALSLTYAWSTGAAWATVVLTAAEDPGDVVTCTVTATTDDGAVATGIAGAVVVNTPPTLTAVSVSPEVVQPGGTLTCTASATDADGDAPTLTYAWSTGATGATLVVEPSAAGSRLACTATATDPDGGVATASASATVYATPTLSGLTLSPDPLYTEDLLTASATVSDADGEAVTLTWDWYVDGALAQSGPDDTLDGATWFDRDQEVYVVLTADDGTTAVEATSATILVMNSPPTAPGLAPLVGEEGVDLTCSVTTASTDVDGDEITSTFAWEVDGAAYEGPTSEATSSTVDGADVLDGQMWTCTVVADDGLDTSEPGVVFGIIGADPPPDSIPNLLVNPGLETGDFTGWTRTAGGGDGWAIKETGLTDSDFGVYAARTSYNLCSRGQVVDLVAAGYTEADLDAAPTIHVADWFRERYDVDAYFVEVTLLDASGGTIDTWSESGTTNGAADWWDDVYFEVAHAFSGYGAGVRYVWFQDGGEDTEYWAGNYGIEIDNAFVGVELP